MRREFADALATILRRIVEEYRPQKVILFGSLAWGHPDEDSDIDLLIVKDSSETPLQRRVQVRRVAAEAGRRIAFSPLVLTANELQHRLDINDSFYHKIVEQGQTLYEQQ
ncbi:MAG: nucleotidyltransferase domain-containing protein [Chloroflexi bacterium]|nr:nucleotidyltransferase domain-containing protein [Chloroflexota bacterium]